MGLALTAACSSQHPQKEVTAQEAVADNDDTTVYGLACDGCTDTIIVVLRNIEGNPDTFNILEASRQRQIFGRPNIGDQLALVRNAEDSTVADLVIDLEELKATWCYEAKPTLRKRADISEQEVQRMLANMPAEEKEKMMTPREYGFQIKGDNEMMPVGLAYRAQTSDDESPFEYPPLKRYRQWRLNNGRLILTETQRDSLGNTHPVSSDTAELVLLAPDTLILRFADGERGYYRRTEN